jgi:peptidoglycan hydrolase CwlO-like protein
MKKSDLNLTAEEYVKYFVTDEDTLRHFELLIDKMEELEDVLIQNEKYQEEIIGLENDIDELNSTIYELKEEIADLKEGLYKK